MGPAEQLLLRPYRSAQLRSSYCLRLQSHNHSVGLAPGLWSQSQSWESLFKKWGVEVDFLNNLWDGVGILKNLPTPQPYLAPHALTATPPTTWWPASSVAPHIQRTWLRGMCGWPNFWRASRSCRSAPPPPSDTLTSTPATGPLLPTAPGGPLHLHLPLSSSHIIPSSGEEYTPPFPHPTSSHPVVRSTPPLSSSHIIPSSGEEYSPPFPHPTSSHPVVRSTTPPFLIPHHPIQWSGVHPTPFIIPHHPIQW